VADPTELSTVAGIQEIGNLEKVPDSLVDPRVTMASRIVKMQVGDDYYTELLAMEGTEAAKIACTQAESLIGVAKTLLVIAHDSSGKGIVGSNILGEGHSNFLSYSDIKSRHDDLMREASEILAPYLYDPDDADEDSDDDSTVRLPGGSMWAPASS